MKKFINVVTVLSVFCSMSVLNVNAVSESVVINLASNEVKRGETFTLDVAITDAPTTGVNVLDFAVVYDTDVLNVVSAELSPVTTIISDTQLIPCETFIDDETGYVSFIYHDTAKALVADDLLFTLTIVVEADAELGKAMLSVAPVPRTLNPDSDRENFKTTFGTYVDGELVQYTRTGDAAIITIVEGDAVGKSGDANCDGTVTVADAVSVAAYTANAAKNPLTLQGIINADVHNTGNGLNATDALTIQQYATGIIKVL